MSLRLTDFSACVFDLDDTLYFEADFVRSGFEAVAELVERLYQVDLTPSLLGGGDVPSGGDRLGEALRAAGLPAALKAELLEVYRYHRPRLRPAAGVVELLAACQSEGARLFVISDGRSVTQRLKLEALGLLSRFEAVYISQELGVTKPDPAAFLKVMERVPLGPWVYVADNPRKDFVAPARLGWSSVGVRHGARRVHPLQPVVQEPTVWVEDVGDLLAFLRAT